MRKTRDISKNSIQQNSIMISAFIAISRSIHYLNIEKGMMNIVLTMQVKPEMKDLRKHHL